MYITSLEQHNKENRMLSSIFDHLYTYYSIQNRQLLFDHCHREVGFQVSDLDVQLLSCVSIRQHQLVKEDTKLLYLH